MIDRIITSIIKIIIIIRNKNIFIFNISKKIIKDIISISINKNIFIVFIIIIIKEEEIIVILLKKY